MEQTNIADLKSKLSDYLAKVQKGQSLEVCRRNIPIAKIVPIEEPTTNKTVLGCGVGTVTIHGDLTEPTSDGDMVSEEPAL